MHYELIKNIQPEVCLVIGVFKKQAATELTALTTQQQVSVQAILNLGDFEAKVGQTTTQYLLQGFDCPRVIFLGLGDKEKYQNATMRKACMQLGKIFTESQIKKVQILLPTIKDAAALCQAVVSLEDANIRRDQLKQTPATLYWPETISFVGDCAQAETALTRGQAIATGIKLVKNLANLPSNHCTPKILADRATEIAQQEKNLNVEIYDEKAIAELKMGSFLAVAQGSAQPPRMIVLKYQGAAADQAPTVFVGKGVTFDTGGISLKPGPHMDEMKYDMCGAATVIATLKTAAMLKLPLNIIGVAVCTENMPSGSAIKPGDVVTSMSGKTVEILNTDAEGRLILCDALTFVERFDPEVVIDIATLTGAVIMALGAEAHGLMANNDALAQALLKAGEASGDRAWQLPLWDEYQEGMDSAFADVANLGNDAAKSITAACFLARFTEKYPWAHFDIAGTAWRGGTNMNRAATGRPLSLLMQYLFQKTADKG